MALVGIILGSQTDLPTMRDAVEQLEEFGIPSELAVVSAHRTPEAMVRYALSARERGLKVIIAGAGGAAHLPGMVASLTTLPVIGVPVPTEHLKGQDSLLSIVQMPAGVPVATVSIGGSRNAALLALRILSTDDEDLATKLETFRQGQIAKVTQQNETIGSDWRP